MEKLINATKYTDILTLDKDIHEEVSLDLWNSIYKDLIKVYHTDVNKTPEAVEISRKLIDFNQRVNKGFKYQDDSGDLVLLPNTLSFLGDTKAIKTSFDNLALLPYEDPIFKLTLPIRESENSIKFNQLVISFQELERPIEQKHVNWLINRCYELAITFNNHGYTYLSFIPNSLVIDPIFHGVFPTSFYHMTKKDTDIKSVSANYSKWYPYYETFREKKATSEIDSKMIRKLALWLLDYKPQVQDLFNFYTTDDDYNIFSSYQNHKALINKNFPPKTFYKF